MTVSIHKAGLLTSLQDLGRSGWRNQGISAAGAMDPLAATLGNLLLQQTPHTPVLEITFGMAELRFGCSGWVALTGADLGARLDGNAVAPWWRFPVEAGQRLLFTRPRQGYRAYLALSGGLEGMPFLGSVSADLAAGLGAPLRDGEVLNWKPQRRFAGSLLIRAPRRGRLRALPGPEEAAFPGPARYLFWQGAWAVSRHADRMGLRLSGPALLGYQGQELASHGVLPGVVQVPGDGQPILLGAEAQSTGGYPKVAMLCRADLWQLGQLGPGDELAFLRITQREAVQAYRQQQAYLARVREHVQAH
ncbi:biotin-dependent carboxyltransferase family protein [Gallaecimonas sp. GXIMD4217]|uniref:5-oxoprolinase subunit C family protein n=1 Tax=Gallaecimonas sp. GXIMD4217 TaxID=3131927 RepID=UPI00311AFC7C